MADYDPIFENLSPSERKKLLEIYERAQEKLSQWALHPTGGKTASADYRATAAMARLNQVDQVIALLKQQAAKSTGRLISASAAAGGRLADEDIRRIRTHTHGKTPVGTSTIAVTTQTDKPSFALVQHDAIRVVARDMASDLNKAADSMGATVKKVLRQTSQQKLSESEIESIISGRLVSGDRAAAIRDLKTELIRAHEGKLVSITTKGGTVMTFKAGQYAEMVVRTKTAEAVTAGQLAQYQREEIDLVVIDGNRTKNFCTEFLGRVYSISGTHTKYPPLSSLPSGGPPFHPNCSKGISAYIEELSTPAQRAAAQPDERTAAIARAGATNEGQRLFRDLQREQVVKERMRGITPEAGPKHRVTASDDPAYLEGQAKSLGVKSVNFAGRSDIGAPTVQAIQQAVSAGMPVPKSVDVSGIAFDKPSQIGEFNYGSHSASFNPKWPGWRDLEDEMSRLESSGVTSSGDTRHIGFHELAHGKFANLGIDHGNAKFTDPVEWDLASKVSKRATANKDEFLAEYTAGRMAGKRYPDAVNRLYVRLSGQ